MDIYWGFCSVSGSGRLGNLIGELISRTKTPGEGGGATSRDAKTLRKSESATDQIVEKVRMSSSGFHLTWKTWKNDIAPDNHGNIMDFWKKLITIMEKWYKPWRNWVCTKNSLQNPLNYLNRLEGRFINLNYNWNGQFFVQMEIGKFVDVNQTNFEITLKIM